MPLEDIVAYLRGELSGDVEASVEGHLFACDRCARLLEDVQRIGVGIAALVRGGRVAASGTDALVSRAERDGLRVRSYRLAPGEEVACTAAPDDAYVVIRLEADLREVDRVDVSVEVTDVASGVRQAHRLEDVVVDRSRGEIVLLNPGERVRGLARTRVRYDVHAGVPGAPRLLGTYRLDHWPWVQRPGGAGG